MGCILKFKATNKVSYCASIDHALVSVLYDILISLSLIITSNETMTMTKWGCCGIEVVQKWSQEKGLRRCGWNRNAEHLPGVLHFQKSLASYRTLMKNKAHTHTKPHKKPGAVTVMHCFNWTQELGLYYAFVLCFIMKFQVHDVGCSDVKSVIFVFNLLTFFINVNKSITQS